MSFKLDSHNVLFVLGLLIATGSAVAQQLGADSHYGMILGAIVTAASQLRSFVEAYKVPDAPTTVVNNVAAPAKIVAPLSGTPDVPPKV